MSSVFQVVSFGKALLLHGATTKFQYFLVLIYE